MEELSDYLWETLYILKGLYDHEKGKGLLERYAGLEIDGDYFYEMAMEAIGYVFEDTRLYYDEEKEIEVNVFFDPIIAEFFRLCGRYEAENGIQPENNRFRNELTYAIDVGFRFNSYSYNYHVYTDTSRKNGCRIVLLFDCEFINHYEAVVGLLEVYDAFVDQTQRLKEALDMSKKGEIIPIPENNEEMEAAA